MIASKLPITSVATLLDDTKSWHTCNATICVASTQIVVLRVNLENIVCGVSKSTVRVLGCCSQKRLVGIERGNSQNLAPLLGSTEALILDQRCSEPPWSSSCLSLVAAGRGSRHRERGVVLHLCLPRGFYQRSSSQCQQKQHKLPGRSRALSFSCFLFC